MLIILFLFSALLPDGETDVIGPVVLTDEERTYAVGPYLHVLEDPEGRWTLTDVTGDSLAQAFVPSGRDVPSFGYTRSAYWLRFAVRDEASDVRAWLLEISEKSLDYVTVYTVPFIEGFGVKRLGDALPFTGRDVRHRSLVVPLPAGVPAAYTVYLRVASHGPVRLPLTILSAEAFAEQDRAEHLFLGAFFGILFIMAVYNLSLYVALRDRSYLYYVLYILSFLLYQLSVERFGVAYLWSESLWWTNSFLALFCAVWAFQFSRSYLQTRHFAPLLDRAIVALEGFCLLLMALVFLGARSIVNPVIVVFFAAASVLLLATGIVCLLRGDRAAIYYLLAWSFLLVGIFVGMLGDLGFMAQGLFGTRGVQIGSALEATLLSIGLGYRYDQLRRERERMRLRIATDLHDDIGSDLTEISLYSELVRRASSGQTSEWAEETGALARGLTGKMQDIVWAVRPEGEGWDALEARIKDAATRLVAPAGIAFDMQGDVEHRPGALSIDVRKNVLMMVKEMVHNAVKHAGCSRIEVRFRLTRDALWLRLCDDGCGFDQKIVSCNNGLKNLEHRAREIQGHLSLETKPGGPTCYTLDVPLGPAGSPYPNRWGRARAKRRAPSPTPNPSA